MLKVTWFTGETFTMICEHIRASTSTGMGVWKWEWESPESKVSLSHEVGIACKEIYLILKTLGNNVSPGICDA